MMLPSRTADPNFDLLGPPEGYNLGKRGCVVLAAAVLFLYVTYRLPTEQQRVPRQPRTSAREHGWQAIHPKPQIGRVAPSTSTFGKSTSSIQSETPPEERRDSARPGTPSSSQSAAWDPVSYRIGAASSDDRSSSAPSEFWPRSDSDTAEEEGPSTSITGKTSGTARFFRAILQRFGRSYNKRYEFLPNDAQEKNRNVLQHKILLEVFDGRLHLAPVVKPRRVLDLGTGPGDWVLGFGKRNPKCAVLGVDVEHVYPEYELPNCRFQVFDFTEKWTLGSFDFIHLRML
ncbi:hypothetical protein F5X99DRAFT_429259 [Biscogniauxia marginata]|nr:hypothetical protein F5X99DRAFT_429259 [Biscogniauxia marginata]